VQLAFNFCIAMLIATVLCGTAPAWAAPKIFQHEKCDGKVASYSEAGVTDRSIGSGLSMCYFVSNTEIGKRILRTCPIGSECHVLATVENDASLGDWSPVIIALDAVIPQSSVDQELLCSSSDEVKPIPQSLAAFANTLFGEDAASGTVYRCMNNTVYLCSIGNGFSCDKPSTRRDNPSVARYCRENPDSSVPMAVSGHGTIYGWSCVGRKAVISYVEKIDPRGYRADMWTAVMGVRSAKTNDASEWAKEAERCSDKGDAACERAKIEWDNLVAAGCEYTGRPHSFDPNGWHC
jgi:hypothetical protein